ncbi:MAG: hypothetical protein ACRD37_12140, partial [Candidatus Acidiferrales bacterium]
METEISLDWTQWQLLKAHSLQLAGRALDRFSLIFMMGNDPLLGGETDIPAKITTVSLQLLNGDGSVNQVVSYNPFEDITLDSPVFQKALYGDG